ncbi:MAG: TetR/AcrR family transcriptional regulator [Chthoniobacterales bacterium]
MPKRSQNTEMTARYRIIKGARRHFLAHGFRGVTMDDLAAELGMSKKTLYTHFRSKTALLEAVLADKFGEVEAELSAVTGDERFQFPERLHALLACVRKHTEEVQPPFMRDVAREMPELFEKVRAHRRSMIHRHFASVLREGVAAGMIRSDVPERIMIEFLVGAADSIVNPQKLTELGLTARAAFTEIIILFLEGVMTGQGRFKL